ncbi:MAG: fatty acid desaturase [Bryobacterales bacterium]|nr:fatty acid desaturase [Bryobacterales bacterium]
MTRAEYFALRSQLHFEQRLVVTLGVIAADLLLLAVAVAGLYGFAGKAGYWLAQPLLAIFYFHNFALLHDCGHGSVHRKTWVNALIGHYHSLFCFLPFYPWRDIHNEHHSWTGNLEKDPTLKKVRQLRAAGRIPFLARLAWYSWIPLAGLLQHTVFWMYPWDSYRQGKLRGARLRNSLFSIGLLAVAYTAWALWAPAEVSAAAIWPSFVIYLAGVELVNLPHHAGMPTYASTPERPKLHLWEQHLSTRSCFYPLYLSELLVLNFNLHTEHHFFPTLPWYRLRNARLLLKRPLATAYTEEFGVEWNTLNRKQPPEAVLLHTKQIP